jgi:hypothetical protein
MTLRRHALSPLWLCLLVALSIGGTACLAQQLVGVPPIDGPAPPTALDPGASLQPISVFDTAVPDNAVEADHWSGTPGSVSASSFYRGVTNTQPDVATLYSATGAQVPAVYLPQETGPIPGWQVAQFASPTPISAEHNLFGSRDDSNCQLKLWPWIHGKPVFRTALILTMNALFAISGNTAIVSPGGPGVSGLANTTQNITIQATSP